MFDAIVNAAPEPQSLVAVVLGTSGTLVGGALTSWWLLTRGARQERRVRLQDAYAAFAASVGALLFRFDRANWMVQLELEHAQRMGPNADPLHGEEIERCAVVLEDTRAEFSKARSTLLLFERDLASQQRIEAFVKRLNAVVFTPGVDRSRSPLDQNHERRLAGVQAHKDFEAFLSEASRLTQLG